MSAEYKDQDPLAIAKEAERDLNSQSAKRGHGASDSCNAPSRMSFSLQPECVSTNLHVLCSQRIRRRRIRNLEIPRQHRESRFRGLWRGG